MTPGERQHQQALHSGPYREPAAEQEKRKSLDWGALAARLLFSWPKELLLQAPHVMLVLAWVAFFNEEIGFPERLLILVASHGAFVPCIAVITAFKPGYFERTVTLPLLRWLKKLKQAEHRPLWREEE